MKATISFVLLAAASIAAVADDTLDSRKAALETIQQFASQICIDVPLAGKSENIELSGSAKVELENFLKKLADIGIEGSGNYQGTDYTGVLQQDLAALAGKSMDCKMAMANKLIDRFLPDTQALEAAKPDQGKSPAPEQPPANSDWIPEQDTYQHDYYKGLSVSVESIQPNDKGQIEWTLLFKNEGQKRHGTGFDLGKSYVSDDQGKQYKVLGATIQSKELVYMQPGMSYRYTFTSEKPDATAKALNLYLDNRQFAGKHPIIKANRDTPT